MPSSPTEVQPPQTETTKILSSADFPLSTQIEGLPFGNIFSVSDGPPDNSTGVMFFYVTPMDNTVSDLRRNPFASLTLSEAEGDFCRYSQTPGVLQSSPRVPNLN